MRTLATILSAALLALALPATGRAQALAGTYSAQGDAGSVILTLSVSRGKLSGTLAGGAERFTLEGVVDEDGDGEGTMRTPQGNLYFAVEVDGNDLLLLVAEMGSDGEPNFATAREIAFTRGAAPPNPPLAQGREPAPGAAPSTPAPPAGALHDGTPLAREWSQLLAGRKLTKMESYSSGSSGGYSSRADAYLCSNGEFLYRDQSSVSVDVGGAFGNSSGQGGEQGRWRIITQGQVAGIEFRMANGNVAQARLDRQDGKTFVDGQRVLVTPAEICP